MSYLLLVLLYVSFCVFLLAVESGGWGFPWLSTSLLAVGVFMLGTRVNAVLERQEIEVTDDTLSIHKRRPLSGRRHTIPHSDIESIAVESVVAIDPATGTAYATSFSRVSLLFGRVRLPAVTHGAQQKTHFAESVSDEEMKWLVSALRTMIARKRGRST